MGGSRPYSGLCSSWAKLTHYEWSNQWSGTVGNRVCSLKE